jgi:hypothetical protein
MRESRSSRKRRSRGLQPSRFSPSWKRSRNVASKYVGSKYVGSKYVGSEYVGSEYVGSEYVSSGVSPRRYAPGRVQMLDGADSPSRYLIF